MTAGQRSQRVQLTVDGVRLTAGFEIVDPAVRTSAASAAMGSTGLDEWLGHVVRVGVTACDAVTTRTDLDRLEAALAGLDRRVGSVVDEAVARLSEHVSRHVDPETNGLAQVSRDSMQRLSEGVSRLVGSSDGVLATNIKALVGQVFADAQTSIHSIVATQATTTQQVLQQDRDAMRSAMLQVAEQQHNEVRTALNEIRQSIAVTESVRLARSNTAARGTDYEADCLRLLQAIAARSGDAGGVSHTARTAGADGTLVGDITISLTGGPTATGATLVVECKDRRGSNKPSVTALKAEGRAARMNRKAETSLLLVSPECMPVQDQLVLFLEPNSLCVCWAAGDEDALVTAAFLMLKMLALSHASAVTGEVDLGRMRRQLAEAETALCRIDDITKHAGKAERSIVLLKQTTAELKADLLRRLMSLSHTLDGEQDDGPAGQVGAQSEPGDGPSTQDVDAA